MTTVKESGFDFSWKKKKKKKPTVFTVLGFIAQVENVMYLKVHEQFFFIFLPRYLAFSWMDMDSKT